MTATMTQDYTKLDRDSSDLLMEWDGLSVLGRHEEAAFAVRRAGDLRRRMGQLALDAGDAGRAAEDWLSATECYVQAHAEKEARSVLTRVQELEATGRVPPERTDLIAALREREKGVRRLEGRIRAFSAALRRIGKDGAGREKALAFLLGKVPALAGHAVLHFLISRYAEELGRTDLAAAQLLWATRFDPGNTSAA